MLSHDVFFTLKDRPPAAAEALVASCRRHLAGEPGTVFFSAGVLIPDLDREVNDRDFDVALHVVFEDRAAHDAYQDAPAHHRFIEENQATWARVRVFDSEVEGGTI